jgi:hypothetical protein
MTEKKSITGVSAVNDEGVVVVFVEASMPDFDRFDIVGSEIRLISSSEQSLLSRTYGTATIETVTRSGLLVIQKIDVKGDDAGNYVIEAAHGL